MERQEKEGLEFLKENGMTVYEPTEEELEKWHKAVFDGSYGYITNLIGKDTVDAFLKQVEEAAE